MVFGSYQACFLTKQRHTILLSTNLLPSKVKSISFVALFNNTHCFMVLKLDILITLFKELDTSVDTSKNLVFML